MPSEFQPLADAIYRDRVLRARRTPPAEKLLDGARLFAGVAERMKAGIRLRKPHLSEREVAEELRRILRRLAQVQNAPMAPLP